MPGAIQPHGVLFALEEPELRVLQASAGSQSITGCAPEELLGQLVGAALDPEQLELLQASLKEEDLKAVNPVKLTMARTGNRVNGIVHRHNGVLFLELEPTGDSEPPLHAYQRVQRALATLQTSNSLQELWRRVAREIRELLSFDRVMIYKFDAVGNGEVIEEVAAPEMTPYLGLHYPASDIPKQARLLYSQNWIRHIPDVNYERAELIPLIYPVTRELTDLSHSTLRSVSPLHVEYLQNMGVAASLSVSIMHGTRLWGLIACHHRAPRFIAYELRSACELLGQVVSLRMVALESESRTHNKAERNVMRAKFLEALATSKTLKAALLGNTSNLLNYVPADGCAVVSPREILTLGTTPSQEQIAAILKRIRRILSPIFVTDELSAAMREAAQFKDTAAGLLSVCLSKQSGIYVMWFRTEQVRTVNWGGNPSKPLEEGDGSRLHPRKSFELWKEVVHGKSLPWTTQEVEAATELRGTLTLGLLEWAGTAGKATTN